MAPKDPYRPVDDEARALARQLTATARFAALAVRDASGAPMVSRIAVAPGPDGVPMALVSDLSLHSQCLQADPVCSLLVGEPGDKGDPLTHPRMTLQASATFIRHGDADHPALADRFVAHQPKTKLYIGFGDFAILRFALTAVFLNGGFGKAYKLAPSDLITPTAPGSAGSEPR